jgi:hypothetical protein
MKIKYKGRLKNLGAGSPWKNLKIAGMTMRRLIDSDEKLKKHYRWESNM